MTQGTVPTHIRDRDRQLALPSRVQLAYCIDTMHVGGTEMNAVRVAERLDRSRFRLIVVSLQPDGPLAERYRAAGVPVFGFPLSSLYAPSTVRAGFNLVRLLRTQHIDIVHCHDLYANLFAVPWARIAGVTTVIASRRWVHPVGTRALEVANRAAYRIAHRVLANSHSVASAVVEKDGVSADRVLNVSNFVDEGAFHSPPLSAVTALRAELKLPKGAPVIGIVARLAPVKDHATLLRAFAILQGRWPSARLVIVGDGELRKQLEDLAIALGVGPAVCFAGQRPHALNLHHLFDISVLSSLSEGFPNSIVEAMAAGRPVVATEVGGTVDAVRPETGILVPPGRPDALANGIERLMADSQLRAAMGAQARQIARSEFHADAVIPRLEQIYVDLIKRSVK